MELNKMIRSVYIFVFDFLQQSTQILIIKTRENNNQKQKDDLRNNATREVHILDPGPQPSLKIIPRSPDPPVLFRHCQVILAALSIREEAQQDQRMYFRYTMNRERVFYI